MMMDRWVTISIKNAVPEGISEFEIKQIKSGQITFKGFIKYQPEIVQLKEAITMMQPLVEQLKQENIAEKESLKTLQKFVMNFI